MIIFIYYNMQQFNLHNNFLILKKLQNLYVKMIKGNMSGISSKSRPACRNEEFRRNGNMSEISSKSRPACRNEEEVRRNKMAPCKKKEKMRKTMLCFYFCLMNEEFTHMLRWTNKEEGIFSILFKHMKSRTWDTKYLDFFKVLDNLSPKKSLKYAKEDSEGCKRRCKANLQKLCNDGVFKFIKQKSIDKCTKIKYYKFVEMPQLDCISDSDFSSALRENIKNGCSSKVYTYETIELVSYEMPESVYRRTEPVAPENAINESIMYPVEVPFELNEEVLVSITVDGNDIMVSDNQIFNERERNDILGFKNQALPRPASEIYEELFTDRSLSRREATTNKISEDINSEMCYNQKDNLSVSKDVYLSCCSDKEELETFNENSMSYFSFNDLLSPFHNLESENSMDTNDLLFYAENFTTQL